MQQSLVKTLAAKLKISVAKVYQKYRTTLTVDGTTYKVLQETVQTDKGPKIFTWGGIPLKRHQGKIDRPLNDNIRRFKWSDRSDLVTRLLRGECEICGSDENIEVHHIRKLKDLKNRWQGRKQKPEWIKRMIALSRKTLVVCRKCHNDMGVFKMSWKSGTSLVKYVCQNDFKERDDDFQLTNHYTGYSPRI
jgi:hypothetical protein